MDAREKGQRNNVLKALNDAKSIFKQEYEEQDEIIAGSFNPNVNFREEKMNDKTDISGDEEHGLQNTKQNLRGPTERQSNKEFEEKLKSVNVEIDSLERAHLQGDNEGSEAVQWHLGEHMRHAYFLDTMENIRLTSQCFVDMCLLITIMCLIMGSFGVLRTKGIIGNYHERWLAVPVL